MSSNYTEGYVQIHPVADIFPPMTIEQYAALKNDIAVCGLREPVWLWQEQLIDGRHRVRACEELGVELRTQDYTGDDPVRFVVSLNLHRRHLDESQRAMVAANIANLEDGQTKAGAPIGAASQEDAAYLLNVSRRSVQRAAMVQNEGAPELVAAVQSGVVSVGAAADVATLPKQEQAEIVARGEAEILEAAKRIRWARTEQTNAKNAELRRAAASLPVASGSYRTVVIDPPWPIEFIQSDSRPNQLSMPYPTMSLDEIAAFQLPLADDATVFCWTTQRFLPDTFRILEAWGLKYLVTMVWHKTNGFQPFNLPKYNCEFVVVGRKGSPLFMDTKAFSVCFDGKRREHSRKPDEFYQLIERVCAGPRIDIFSREKRSGFDQYGVEVDKFAVGE